MTISIQSQNSTPLLPAFTETRRADCAALVGKIVCMDALTLLAALPDNSVDMVLCDLPYGYEKTKTAWDSNKAPIDYQAMWAELKRIIKQRGAIVLTAAQPFTTDLISTNREMFRYMWYWQKPRGSNFGNCHYQPLRVIEDILVFSHCIASPNQFTNPDDVMVYYPQKVKQDKVVTRADKPEHRKLKSPSLSSHVHNPKAITRTYEESMPTSALYFAMDSDPDRGMHPTQKPVDLFSYLISTYTRENDIVLDMTCGSGTTALACRKTGRRFICGDNSPEYVALANRRLMNTDAFQDTVLPTGERQLSLWGKLESVSA